MAQAAAENAREQPLQHEQLRWLRRRRGPAPAPEAPADDDDMTAPVGPHPRRVEPRDDMSAEELRLLQSVLDHQHGASRRLEHDLIQLEAPHYRRYSSSALVGVLGLIVLAVLPDEEKFGPNRDSMLFPRTKRNARAPSARAPSPRAPPARDVDAVKWQAPDTADGVASENELAESGEARRAAGDGRDEEPPEGARGGSGVAASPEPEPE